MKVKIHRSDDLYHVLDYRMVVLNPALVMVIQNQYRHHNYSGVSCDIVMADGSRYCCEGTLRSLTFAWKKSLKELGSLSTSAVVTKEVMVDQYGNEIE